MSHDLFGEHRESALRIARVIGAKLPRNVDREDLEQAALIGLHEWCTKHPDSSQEGWRFGLNMRVRGAVFDWVRKEDYLTRRARERGDLHVGHLEDLRDEDGPGWQDLIGQVDAQLGDYSRLDARAALEALSERDREVVQQLLGGALQREVAAERGVSEPRISQLLTRATATMRLHLERDRRVVAQVLATPRFRPRDLKREMWLARRNALWQQLEPGMSMWGLAHKLKLPEVTVYHWCVSRKTSLYRVDNLTGRDPIHTAMRQRAKELLVGALKEAPTCEGAAALLMTTQGVVSRWRRQIAPTIPRCKSGCKPKVHWDQLAALYGRGLSTRQVAKQLGMSKAGVSHALRVQGLSRPPNTDRRRDISAEDVRRLRAEKLSIYAIARRLRCSMNLVRRRLEASP